MLHLFKSAAARAVTYGLIGLLVAGLLIGAVRLALPFADIFRSQLEDVLSATLGLEVKIGHLELRLAGIAPQLSLEDTLLLDPNTGNPRLSLDRLRVDLNLATSLRELAPHIESLTLVGAHLVIKRRKNGTLVVAGLEALEAEDPEAMTFFLGNGSFGLTDSDLYWIDEKSGVPALHLSDVRVHFENKDRQHRVGIIARLYGDRQTHLRLVGNMRGEPGQPADWSGKVYLHWRGRNLDRILQKRLPAGLQVGSQSVEIESWSQLEGMIVTESVNRITAEELLLWDKPGEDRASPVRVDELEGLLRWRRIGSGWQIQIKDLLLTRGGSRRPSSDLNIQFTTGNDGGWAVEGGNSFLRLTDANDLLAWLSQPIPTAVASLGEVRPDGELYELRFRFVHRPTLPPLWAISGRIENLSLGAYRQLPGFSGLDAEIAVDERTGTLLLSTDGMTLDLPRLMPDPIRLEKVAGKIHWQRDADGALRIASREIVANNADLTTRSRFSITLPANGGAPFLDLYTAFCDGQAAAVRRYIPSKRLKEKLATWLDRAFVKGRIPSGALLFRGSPADFPFDAHQGRFEVLFDVEDTTLSFHPDWPPIKEITGEVHFENHRLEISASQGRILDSAVVNITARISNLKRAVAVEIQGRTEGPFANALRMLSETPLRKKLGVLADSFQVDGVAQLDLDMVIPLRHKGRKGPLRLTGALSWPGPATLAIVDRDIRLTDLAGTLGFTERTLEAETIEAKLWDVPVRLGIETREPQGDGGSTTHIQVTGRFPTTILARQFPSNIWTPVKGRARLELRLDIGPADLGKSVPPIDFELMSNLAGIAIELPEPVGKAAAETRRLHLSGRLTRGKPLRAKGAYDDLGINLELNRNGDEKPRLIRGVFHMGASPLPLPKDKGLHVQGAIPTLDLWAWLDVPAEMGPSAEDRRGENAGLRSVSLRIQRILLGDTALDNAWLTVDRRSKSWEVKIKAREAEGTVTIPHRSRDKPVRIRLSRLDLQGLLDQEGEEGLALADNRQTDPRHAHTLDLSIEQLLWGENTLGRVNLRSQATPDGQEFSEITLAGPSMTIEGQGSWKQTGEDPHSNLSITAQGSDLGKFLRSLEFKSLFYKAPADVRLDLSWPGGPLQLSAADLKGKIKLDVGAGSLLEVEPGVGRMLGILNLEALQRRLTLDFSDLFGRGYAFEKISGQLDIANGTATIEDLVIEGPSANISIAGSTNLVDQELNQIVTVTPRIGTSVAIASAVAGGPLVGAAVFLADQVSGGAVDKLGRYQYTLSGPWATPVVRRGKLGAGGDQERVQGQFLEDPERAGASGTRESRPGQAQARPPAQQKASGPAPNPASSQGDHDENLFLEGY